MLAKILLFMIVFFIVANPATFKLMRQLLGGWVATAEGVAKPGGLLLHSVVFVLLAVALPRALMRRSSYADEEEYEEDEYEEDGEGYADLMAEADKADAEARIAADKAKMLRAQMPNPAATATLSPSAVLPPSAPGTAGVSKYAYGY